MDLDELRRSTKAVCTIRDVAALMEVNERTVSQAIHDGTIPAIRLGRRIVIPREPLLTLLTAAPSPSHLEPSSESVSVAEVSRT